MTFHIPLLPTYTLLAILSFAIISILFNHSFIHSFYSTIPFVTPHNSLICAFDNFSPNSQHISEVFPLHSPNPKSLLFSLYHCLTTIQENKQHPPTLKLQVSSIHQISDSTHNFPTKFDSICSWFINNTPIVFKFWYTLQSCFIYTYLTLQSLIPT